MEKELVSIIIPTYNRGNIIKETINSVLNQTYQHFELLIIDDGSTDDTKKIVQSIKDNRISYFWQENSGLPAKARNEGLKNAKGNYIAFLDSDDLWLPNKLEKQIKMFEKNEDLLLVSTNGTVFNQNISYICFPIQKNKIISFKELLKENIIINSSVLMKKDVINAIGFLDEERKLKSMEDYDYWLRLLNYKDKSILVLKDLLIKYRLHEFNILKKVNILEKYKMWYYIFSKFNNFNQTYMNAQLRKRLRYHKSLKIERLVFQNKIGLSQFLKNEDITLHTKLLVFIKYYNKKYQLKCNFYINLLEKFLKFIYSN